MYLLDTNVVSELRRLHPHPTVVRWVEQVDAEDLFLSAVTVGEIQAGIEFTCEQDVARARGTGGLARHRTGLLRHPPDDCSRIPGMGAA